MIDKIVEQNNWIFISKTFKSSKYIFKDPDNIKKYNNSVI